MQRDFDSVLQGARMMVDCEGRPQTTWRTRRYSSALLGADREGRAVLVHVRTPYRMQMLAAPALGVRGLVYMEGGPEASLIVEAPGVRVREIGSYEDGFHEGDDVRAFWDLPNVVAFGPREQCHRLRWRRASVGYDWWRSRERDRSRPRGRARAQRSRRRGLSTRRVRGPRRGARDAAWRVRVDLMHVAPAPPGAHCTVMVDATTGATELSHGR